MNEDIKRLIRKHLNAISDDMATGQCKDWADYQRRVGMIEALALLERDILDAEKRANAPAEGED